jgi:hypothetical protein
MELDIMTKYLDTKMGMKLGADINVKDMDYKCPMMNSDGYVFLRFQKSGSLIF